MTFADLFETLTTRGVLPRAKDCKTALLLLAQALGAPSLEACQVEAACQDEALWGTALETHFAHLQTKGRALSRPNRRNIRSNLRTVFRVAAAHGLLHVSLPSRLLMPSTRRVFVHQQQATAPYQATYRPQASPRRFSLPQAEWPPDIQAGWRTYRVKCGFRLREITLQTYAKGLTIYLGYVANICGRTPTWSDVFDVAQLEAFVRWHGARVGRPVSAHGWRFVCQIAAMAVVLKHSQARELADFRQTLQEPAPLHNKRAHMVSLATLEEVADACLAEGRAPYLADRRVLSPGLHRVLRFQKGVMLKLLVRSPLRQRNLRELRLEDHLYKDPDTGHWQLHFQGGDLKIGIRQGRVNEYKLDLTEFCPEFIPVLEEFIREYRPRLPGAATSPFLFLTQYGTPYTERTLRVELKLAVAMRTGKRWYPHLIRTAWATEYLTSTDAPDWTTAAVMLGDKVATVMARYHDLVDQAHHPKAKAFLDKQLRTG